MEYWDAEWRREFVHARDRPAVTGELLRSLPLGAMKQAVFDKRNDPLSFIATESRLDAGGGISDQFLEKVAKIYEDAVRGGRPPLVTIAKAEKVSKPAASKWVAMARRRGLLGFPTRPGRSGFTADHSPWKGHT